MGRPAASGALIGEAQVCFPKCARAFSLRKQPAEGEGLGRDLTWRQEQAWRDWVPVPPGSGPGSCYSGQP